MGEQYVLIGIICSLGATLCGTISKIMWKLAHNIRKEGEERRASVTWWWGTFVLILNPPLDIAAFAMAPQGVISATAGTSSLFNLMLAPHLVGERWTCGQVVGAVAVTMGCICVALFGPQENSAYQDMDEVLALYLGKDFLTVVVAMLTLLIACMLAINTCDHPVFLRFAWGTSGGIVAGFSYCFTKTMTIFAPMAGAWSRGELYIVIVLMAVTAIGATVILNEGLRRIDALYIAPTFQATQVVAGSACGITLFREMVGYSRSRLLQYWASLAFVVVGVFVCVGAAKDSPVPVQQTDQSQAVVKASRSSRKIKSFVQLSDTRGEAGF